MSNRGGGDTICHYHYITISKKRNECSCLGFGLGIVGNPASKEAVNVADSIPKDLRKEVQFSIVGCESSTKSVTWAQKVLNWIVECCKKEKEASGQDFH